MATTNVVSALINIDQARKRKSTNNLPGTVMHVHLYMSHAAAPRINLTHPFTTYQDALEPWPLEMADLQGTVHPLNLRPGEFVMYESAVCAHARPWPLRGSHYTNLFMRFRPAGWTFSYE